MVWVIPLSATDVSARSLSPDLSFTVFAVCQELAGFDTPASYQ